jgi:hypothetical protein
MNFNMNKFNSLIDKAAELVSCGPECQNEKKGNELKQKYLNAKLNTVTAPHKEDIAEKNYMVYTHGETVYNEFRRKKLTIKAERMTQLINKNLSENLQKSNTELDSYSAILLNFRNIADLYLKYKRENVQLTKELKMQTSDTITNNRKTYYEAQSIDTLQTIYTLFLVIYIIGVVVFLISLFAFPSSSPWYKNLAIFIFLVIYPFISLYLFKKVYHFYYFITSKLPKNVYKSP